jgi:hypothetical protein
MTKEIRFGESVTLVLNSSISAQNAECTNCEWSGTPADCRDATVQLIPGMQLPLGECPSCGMACRDPLIPDLEYIRANYEQLRRSEQGAREGLGASRRKIVEMEHRIMNLENDVSEAKRRD